MNISPLLSLSLLLVMVAVSAFFSGSETALFSLSQSRRKKLSKQKRGSGPLISELLEHPLRLLIAIVIGNMFANTFAAALAAQVAVKAFGSSAGLAISILAMTVVIVVFGEILPKTFAVYNNESLARFAAPSISIWANIIAPVRKLLGRFADKLISLLGEYSKGEKARITSQELRSAIPVIGKSGVLDQDEIQMLDNILSFRDRNVRDVMRPVNEVVSVDILASVQEIIRVAKEHGYTRIPMYEGRPENIVGVLYVKDLLIHSSPLKKPPRKLLLRPPYFVPERMEAGQLFKNMTTGKTHMALVVNEYGAVQGLVTLEDLVEEIVGEIHDEIQPGKQ